MGTHTNSWLKSYAKPEAINALLEGSMTENCAGISNGTTNPEALATSEGYKALQETVKAMSTPDRIVHCTIVERTKLTSGKPTGQYMVKFTVKTNPNKSQEKTSADDSAEAAFFNSIVV